MAPQNWGDARHVCYGRPTNQAINQLAKDIKIQKIKQNEKKCRCWSNQTQNDTCKDGVQDKLFKQRRQWMNGHNKDWQLALQTMFQMPFLFVLDPKTRSLCCKSFFQLRKFVLIYLITLFQQIQLLHNKKLLQEWTKLYKRSKVLSPILNLLINIVSFLQLFM